MTRDPAARSGGVQAASADTRADASLNPLTLLRGLTTLQRATSMYPSGHPMVARKLNELNEVIGRHFPDVRPDPRDAAVMDPVVRLDIIDGDVHLDGMPYRCENKADETYARELFEIGIHSIHIESKVTPEELLSLAQLLQQFKDEGADEPVESKLLARGVTHISVGRLVPLDTRWYTRQWPDAPTGPLDPAYAESLMLAEQTFQSAAEGKGVDPLTVRDLVRMLIERVAQSNVALGQILALKQYENLTYCHSVNVATLSLLLGRQLQLDDTTVSAVVEAALLHDIGKTRIPLEILKKPGTLDRHERRLIESHTTLGAEILVEVEGLHPLTPIVALEHHRDLKGAGYPDLDTDRLPHPLAQLVAVADTYEALTGARTYQQPAAPEQACLIMARLAGERLNAALVKAFVNAVTFFPIGSLVRTNRDETAVVVRTNPDDPLHPVLALVGDDPEAPRREIDTSLRTETGGYERHIAETLRPPDDFDLAPFMASVPEPARSY